MDVERLARAIVGLRIGAVPLTWDEAVRIARRVVEVYGTMEPGGKPEQKK